MLKDTKESRSQLPMTMSFTLRVNLEEKHKPAKITPMLATTGPLPLVKKNSEWN